MTIPDARPRLTARRTGAVAQEMVVDCFAGAGGASLGIEAAIGRAVDLAINHDEVAVRVHTLNHPHTRHLQEDVWQADPVEETRGRRVGLLWASPDCTHFSKAKGGKPRQKKIRSLAWVVVKWARQVRPRVIILENVEEFKTWGPLDPQGQPIKARAGETFRRWKGQLERLGYQVEHRELVAADYGTPTTRKRFFLIARCDGLPIAWPERTHAPRQKAEALGLLPWRSAAECIDWSLECPSIFLSKEEARAKRVRRPLADATLRRIAKGLRKFVFCEGGGEPFIAVCAAYIEQFYSQSTGSDAEAPLPAVTGQRHIAEVQAFLVKYFGTGGQHGSLHDPAATITAKARLGVVTVRGADYQIVDIGLRMLQPMELLRAQFGRFAAEYVLSGTKAQQVAGLGNSVCPELAEALVRANYQEDVA